MRKLTLLLLAGVLLSGCSRLFSAKKVECCEKKAACCYEQMCCLPRYARAAGVEPKPFTTSVPVYGTAQELEPPPGAVIVKPGLFARLNPFRRAAAEQKTQAEPEKDSASQDGATGQEDEGGFFGRLFPF